MPTRAISSAPTTSAGESPVLRVLVDDVRVFRDRRPARLARTSREALALLDELGDVWIDELWLDHDLIGGDTVQPLVDRLVALAAAGAPARIGRIFVHSANTRAGHRITAELQAAGYRTTRSFAANICSHAL